MLRRPDSPRPGARRFRRVFLAAALAVLAWLRPDARAYNLNESQWDGGPVNLVIALGPAGRVLQDGSTSWDAVAQSAVADWNAQLGLVRFAATVNDGAVPVQGDSVNTVAFSDTVEGDEFGDETIAVTLLKYNSTTHFIDESDVLVNRKFTFDSYAGPLQGSGSNARLDLHRVLLHEFGHVLGLLHPDSIGQSVVAVMNSVISNTDHLTTDDTDGTTAIYGDPALLRLDILANRLTVEDGRSKIYAEVVKPNGKGQLKVIDPYLNEIVASVPTGRKPGVLTESGGGEHLYLGIDSRGAIDQIDPDTLITTQEFTLGAQPGVTAADINVLPGAPESLLVSQVGNALAAMQHNQPSGAGDFAVYDGGVLRPDEVFDDLVSTGSYTDLDDQGQTFYAFSNIFDGSPGNISRLTLEPSGVSAQVKDFYFPLGEADGGASFRRDTIYSSDGTVTDLSVPVSDAVFADPRNAGGADAMTVDENLGQAYFVVPILGTDSGDHKLTVLVESIATRSLLGNIALPRYTDVYAVRRWGANGLLFNVNGGRIFFIRSNLLAPGPVTGPPVVVTLGAPRRSSLDEADTQKAKLAVTRTGSDLSAPLTVRYAVTGTAQPGTDYRALSGAVTIAAGAASATIKVVPAGSHFSDGPRTVQIRLTPELPYRWGASIATVVTLTDNSQ